jgi:hypothetical protein
MAAMRTRTIAARWGRRLCVFQLARMFGNFFGKLSANEAIRVLAHDDALLCSTFALSALHG